jgi:hypothetical protein
MRSVNEARAYVCFEECASHDSHVDTYAVANELTQHRPTSVPAFLNGEPLAVTEDI